MTSRSRIGRWVASLGLLVSVGSAFPTIQWCGLAWSEVTERCLLSEAAQCPEANACEARSSACADRLASQCEGMPPCDATSSCDAARPSSTNDCATHATSPGERRAWCPSSGAPRVTPSGASADPPVAFVVLPSEAPEVTPPQWFHGTWIAEARPPTPPGRDPTTIRGPPSS